MDTEYSPAEVALKPTPTGHQAPSASSAEDRRWMRLAFKLARLGIGFTSPNPLVGAVIVRDGAVLGAGWHHRYGAPHAEAEAVRAALGAGDDGSTDTLAGATLYCTLEPCCFRAPEKHNPPCTDLILRTGIRRVVIANTDPHPKVSGQGVALLRTAGVIVETGLLAAYGEWLNRGFCTFHRLRRPFVHLKLAQSLDGRIAVPSGDSRWISSEAARREVHQMRRFYDAVLVGRGTVAADNPRLTVRLVAGRNPLRVILDSRLSAPPDATVFTTTPSVDTDAHTSIEGDVARTLVLCGANADPAVAARLQTQGVQVIAGDSPDVPLTAALQALGAQGVRSVLVEGGASVFSAFVQEGVWDTMSLYTAPILLGGGLPAVSGLTPERISDAIRLAKVRIRTLDDQVVVDGVNPHPKGL